MKTLFAVGFQASQDRWDRRTVAGKFLGQTPAPTPTGSLSQADRNTVTGRLVDALSKSQEMNSWIGTVGDTGVRTAMGALYDRFNGYITHAAGLASDINAVLSRLQSDSAEDWYVLDTEAPEIDDYVSTINLAYTLYGMKVRSAPTSLPATPSGSAPNAAPVGAKANVSTPPPAMPAAAAQNNLLLGGGILAAVGIATYMLIK